IASIKGAYEGSKKVLAWAKEDGRNDDIKGQWQDVSDISPRLFQRCLNELQVSSSTDDGNDIDVEMYDEDTDTDTEEPDTHTVEFELTQLEQETVKLFSLFIQDVSQANQFLNSHSYLQVGNPCNNASRCVLDYDMDRIFQQEGLRNRDLKSKPATKLSLEVCSNSEDYKISQDLHYVWFSSNQYTAEQRKSKFWKHNKYLKENVKATSQWGHYLWTNSKDFIDDDIQQELESLGVEIRTLEELGLDKEQHQKLAAASYQFAEQKSFGLATDIARYLIIFKEGGVYIDADYQLFNVDGLEQIMCSYNSFFGVERGYDVRLGNGFLAAEGGNKIIEETIDLCYRNIFEGNKSPEYVKSPCTNSMKTIHTTGPITLSIAFTKHARPSEDLLLPYGYLNILDNNIEELTRNNKFCQNLNIWEKNHSKHSTQEICSSIGDRLATQDFSKSWQAGEIHYKSDCLSYGVD
ncbi:MAG: hypothetical protein HRU36_03440, partial [Rickettsiales bacterium]|nr:hypothetical protein [Rickettsiales bacterium]